MQNFDPYHAKIEGRAVTWWMRVIHRDFQGFRYNLAHPMDFDQLITFLEVARQGSFSRAGEKVFRSQSAVSAQIRQLEQEYGDRLLDRSGKTVKLTPAGQIFYEYAERLKNLREESLTAVADHKGTPRGTLRVGANEATCLYVLPEVFGEYCRRYPPVQISIYRNFSYKIVEKLENGAVEVGILTVARSQEVRTVEWSEIDFDKKQWLIPAAKMKVKKGEDGEAKDHLVPLSDQAIAIIKSMPKVGRYVFPSEQAEDHQPMFANALTGCIKRAGFTATMHGMRKTFRNWGADVREHNFRREVLEFCLAHRVGDEAELSYWSSDMIERRREALQAWADFIKPRANTSGEQPPERKRPKLKLVA